MLSKRLLKNFQVLFISTMIVGAFWIFGVIGTGKLYTEYSKLWDYRRLHPDYLPNSELVSMTTMGHETTYASLTWIKLIQFIGDNIGNGKYLDFTHAILEHITELHPYFTRAYEIDLLMAPFLYPDAREEEIKVFEPKIRAILAHGEKGITITCDQDAIDEIARSTLNSKLLKRIDLRNPCSSGMIPYYLGYHHNNDLKDGEKAEYYYKIASMQDDAPKASEFLAILAKSSAGNYMDSALSFFLIAVDGYDKNPFVCRDLATNLAKDIINKRSLTNDWIREIERKETELENQKDEKSPESYATNNCFDSTERGIKQLYLQYISELAKDYPDISDSRELVKKKIITHTPTIQSQKGFYIKKVDGLWKYKTDTPIQ